MPTYNVPGVYVEEISKLPASVAPVATGIPCFIGYTELHATNVDLITGVTNPVTVARRISSLVEYESIFGGPNSAITVNVSSTATELVFGGTPVVINTDAGKNLMYYGVKSYFQNGGGPCYIVSVSAYNTVTPVDPLKLIDGLQASQRVDEPTLLVFPDLVNVSGGTLPVRQTNFYSVYEMALAQCGDLQDRFVIMDTYQDSAYLPSPTWTSVATSAQVLRDKIGTQYLNYGAAYAPYFTQTDTMQYLPRQVRFDLPLADGLAGILDGQTLQHVLDVVAANFPVASATNFKKYVTEEFLRKMDEYIYADIPKTTIVQGPSSAIAGIYASVDRERGVWKAPANVSLSGVASLTHKITDSIQDGLNVHSTGKSINAIRNFTGKGTLVWGARTLEGNSNEWRYVPVRRFFIFVEESIKKATEFMVFEPNDANTWNRARTMISNFLTLQWRDGALAGAKPEDSFFVNVGLGETMSPQDILEGRLIIEIGMAAVRPAEFIILRFMHKLQES